MQGKVGFLQLPEIWIARVVVRTMPTHYRNSMYNFRVAATIKTEYGYIVPTKYTWPSTT